MRDRGRPAFLLVMLGMAGWLCLLFLATANAADRTGVERVRFRNIGVSDGLSQSTGMDIVQDADGFVWIATQDGLDRYDGYGFRVYKHDRSDNWSLASNKLRRLMVDRQGRLWVATDNGGLSRYDSRLDRFDNFLPDAKSPGALGSEFVAAILQDRAARVWVTTRDHVPQRFDESSGGFQDSVCDNRFLRQGPDMVELPDGNLLFGTANGLLRCDTGTGAVSEWQPAANEHLQVGRMHVSPRGEVWVAASRKLYRFSASGSLIERFDEKSEPALLDSDITGLLVDHAGMLWFGSENAGLSRLDPATRRLDVFRNQPGQTNSLASNRAFSLYEDRDGLIWVGTWSNGVSVFDPRTAGFLSVHTGTGPRELPGASVLAVAAQDDGTFWFGTAENGALSHFDLEQGLLQHFAHDNAKPDSLAHNFVSAIANDKDGSLWVGTRGGGLDRLRAGAAGFEHHRHERDKPGSIASDVLQKLYFDRSGTLWISTIEAGVDALCAGCKEFRHYIHAASDPDSLGGGGANATLELKNGEFWIGMRRSGLDRLDRNSGKVTHFLANSHDPGSISSNSITSLHESERGDLWIGTQGGGLNHLLRTPGGEIRFEAITTREGLAADSVGDIAEDAEGRLWLSTTVGISRYDPRTGTVINLGADRGAFANGYFVATGDESHAGRIVFGGPEGATIFDPEQLSTPPYPVPVLTDVRLFNTPVQLRWRDAESPIAQSPWSGGHVVLNYRQSMLSVNFGAPSASAPASVRFAYLLEPHDSTWIDTDASLRTATYTRLAPGEYRLRIRARYPGQPWGTSEASLSLSVLPAPWWSGWAKAGYSLLIGLILVLIWRQIAESRRRRHAVQETIRLSEERLKLSLWGSGAELWDIDLATGLMHRENQLDHLAATREAERPTVAAYRPFVHPEDIAAFEGAMAAHLRDEVPIFACAYRTPNVQHDWVWIMTRGRVVQRDDSGRALRMSGTTHDINALKQAEAALLALNEQLESRVERRTADLQSANMELRRALEQLTLAQRQLLESEKLASLGGLVAGIAHEINTPLGVSVTAASHLQEEAQRLTRAFADNSLTRADLQRFEQSARDSADIILRNLQRADRLVKSFKQVAVDQSSEERRVIDLGVCLGEILITLGPSLKKTPHKVEVDCAKGMVMETLPGVLYQVITNLVMNSLLHGLSNDKPGNIRISAERRENILQIDYRDDGRGMEEAVRAHVFEPFFTTRRGQGGSGLGMHIVYNLVTQVMKGGIACDSAPGQGVHFHMHWPLR
jgi:ligand-binding sensor domain-containing protein/signal transduction histidine kinase